MIKRPILWMLAAYCLGILCKGRYTAVMLSVLFLYVFIFFLIKTKPKFERKIRRTGIFLVFLPAVMLVGCLLASKQSEVQEMDLMLASTKAGKADGSVTGKVYSASYTEKGYKIILTDATVLVEGIAYKDCRILFYADREEAFAIGNRINATGSVRELSEAENPGQFDEFEYYRARRITCKFYAEEMTIIDNHQNYVREFFRSVREHLAKVYDSIFPEDEAGVMKAVLLGDKSTLSDDTNELYRQNGIAHILAISGLHVSLIGNGLFNLLRLCSSPVLPAASLTIAIILGYGCMTDFGISTLRAVGMLIINLLAKCFGRSYDQREACAICGFFILLREPLQLYQVSFRLSFAAAIGIAAFSIEFAKWKKNKNGKLRDKTVTALLSGLAPQLVTTPVILQTYYEIPVYSFFINLLVVPGMAVLVALGLMAGFLGTLSVKLAGFPAGGAYYILKLYRYLCIFMMKLPNPVFLYGNPGILRIILCYGFLLAFFVLADYLGHKYRFVGKSAAKRPLAALVLLLVPLVFIKLPDSSLRLSQLSVGQGDCCVLSCEAGTVMVDCGSMMTSEISRYRLEPFLKYSGIKTIDAIFISHPDKDHISGIAELLQRISNGEFYTGTVSVKRLVMTEAAYKSSKTAELRALAAEKDVEIVLIMAGDMVNCGELKLSCLAPTAENDNAENEGSMILYASYGDFDALFMGDASKTGENAVVSAVNAGIISAPAEYLKVSHHGSKTATSQAFLDALQPQIAAVSYGRGNMYGHPNDQVIQRLEGTGALIYKIGNTGAACFRIKIH